MQFLGCLAVVVSVAMVQNGLSTTLEFPEGGHWQGALGQLFSPVTMVRPLVAAGMGRGPLENPGQDGKILEKGINKKNLSICFGHCICESNVAHSDPAKNTRCVNTNPPPSHQAASWTEQLESSLEPESST
ncbi:hypothetical protein QBC39DRAFT_143642 [Podospora conica]|nr:hypothetical protein QBC39DRAFT_143642 [Schizothecium conicum]